MVVIKALRTAVIMRIFVIMVIVLMREILEDFSVCNILVTLDMIEILGFNYGQVWEWWRGGK